MLPAKPVPCRKMSRLRGPSIALCALLVAPPQVLAHLRDQAQTDPYGRAVIAIPTLRLFIPVIATGSTQDQRVIAGHTVQILAQGSGHQVAVDGRVLATDVEDDRVVIESVHQGGGRTYVLVAEQSGGNACPSLYQAIDLSGVPVISPRIGNCSDIPRVSVVGGALRLFVPGFRAAPAERYVFRDGRLNH